MSRKEDTPFVIDLKQGNQSNYGTNEPSTSTRPQGSSNNNNNELPRSSKLYCLHGRKSEVRDHCHRQRSEGVDVKARKKLIIASILCLLFMICEVIGGILSNSLAIATDAAHLLTDFASFMISLFAIWIAGRPSTKRMSFGWYRAEVIGAMASVVMIWIITAILVWLAVQRLIYRNFEVDATIMLITSGLAILVNLIMGVQLQHGHSHGSLSHGHSHDKKKKNKNKAALTITDPTGLANLDNKTASAAACITSTDGSAAACPTSPSGRIENGVNTDMAGMDAQMAASKPRTFSYQNYPSVNEVNAEIASVMGETTPAAHHHGVDRRKEAVNLNVRAAYIHVLGDMISSFGVFLAALLIYFKPEWAIADPICTFVFSVIVLFTTFGIMKDALLVLMEGTPTYMQYEEVLDFFQQIEGVKRVHNLRIWALSINKIALSVHLAIADGVDPKAILQAANSGVHKRYNFFETTIQIEEFTPQMENCNQCTVPN